MVEEFCIQRLDIDDDEVKKKQTASLTRSKNYREKTNEIQIEWDLHVIHTHRWYIEYEPYADLNIGNVRLVFWKKHKWQMENTKINLSFEWNRWVFSLDIHGIIRSDFPFLFGLIHFIDRENFILLVWSLTQTGLINIFHWNENQWRENPSSRENTQDI